MNKIACNMLCKEVITTIYADNILLQSSSTGHMQVALDKFSGTTHGTFIYSKEDGSREKKNYKRKKPAQFRK